MSINLPSLIPFTFATAATTGGATTIDLRGIDRASLQIDSNFSVGASTSAITLKLSNDGVNFMAFAVARTVTLTGGTTDHAIFELGAIDYAYLQVSFATPSGGNVTLTGKLYATATLVSPVN